MFFNMPYLFWLVVGLLVLFIAGGWFVAWRERMFRNKYRDQNIADEQAWYAAHGRPHHSMDRNARKAAAAGSDAAAEESDKSS